MNNSLIETLQRTMWRRTESDEKEFLDAVDSIKPPVAREVAKALLDTFLPIDDHGTQESVYGALSVADDDTYFGVLGDELPSIISRAPDWAADILMQAIMRKPRRLSGLVLSSSPEVARQIIDFMKSTVSDTPEGRAFLAEQPI